MAYGECNYSSRWRIKRLSHASRFVAAIKLLDMKQEDVFLDYGGGDGHLITLAAESQPDASYSLFEPSANLDEARVNLGHVRGVVLYSSTTEIAPATFSKISCLEVLEHVTPADILPSVLRDIFRLLRPGGTLVVSMPIEFGPVSLFKNIFRTVTRSTFPGTNVKTIALSAVGLASKVPRVEGHMGFDYRKVRRALVLTGFKLEETRFSPIGLAGPLCNSQVLYRLRKPD